MGRPSWKDDRTFNEGDNIVRIAESNYRVTKGFVYTVNRTGRITDNSGKPMQPCRDIPGYWELEAVMLDRELPALPITPIKIEGFGSTFFPGDDREPLPIPEIEPLDKYDHGRDLFDYQKLILMQLAEQSLGEAPIENTPHSGDVAVTTRSNNMDRIYGGPLDGLEVGDVAYSFISGRVIITDLNNTKFSGRPIRAKKVGSKDLFASFQPDGKKKMDQDHQQLFLKEDDMLMARDGHIGNRQTKEIDEINEVNQEKIPVERFTTQTLLNGLNIDSMSDDSIFSAIADMENEIATLDKIENKPARLKRQIANIKQDIADINTYLDANDDDEPVAAS